MVCPKCRRTVPDESTFCLGCGTRLVEPTRVVPVNGDAATAAGVPALRASGGAPPAKGPGLRTPSPAGGKQAYTLSFRPIADERLRYRLARWVCERAPAHALGEVQEGLQRGDFVTFLALTPEEAEATREGIQGLGVAPALLSFTPATAAELLLPMRRAAKPAREPGGLKGKNLVGILLTVVMLFFFGLVVMRLFGGRGF